MKDLYSSKPESEIVEKYPDNEFSNYLRDNFNFQVGYIPNGYDVAFLLVSQDSDNSFNDIWNILFFKEVLSLSKTKTFTIDDVDTIETTGSSFEIYKTFQGSFEEVINVSCELIIKHRETNEEVEKKETVAT